MSNAIFWLSDILTETIMAGDHDWTGDTFKLMLCSSSVACPETTFATGTYTAGAVVVPTTRNGHRYRVKTGGSPTSEPTWPTAAGATVNQDGCVFEEYGGDLAAQSSISTWAAAEVADGDGYTTGGLTLSSRTASRTYSTSYFDAADMVFSSLTKTCRFGAIYNTGLTGDELVGYILFDEDFLDVTVSGVDFETKLSSLGLFVVRAEV